MKKKILFSLLVLFVFHNLFSAENTIYNKNIKNPKALIVEEEIETKKSKDNAKYLESVGIYDYEIFHYFTEINYETGSLIILWKYNQEYVSEDFYKGIKNYISEARPALRLYFKNLNEEKYTKAIDQKYFKVGDKTEKANVYYLRAEKSLLENEDPFKEKITLYEIVEFLDKKLCVKLSCFIVPFKTLKKESWNKATSTDQIVEMFGLPDLIETYFFEWPDEKTKNGLYYTPKVNSPISGEHWRYSKFPDLVIDISEGKKVRDFSTNRNNKFYQ